MHGITTAIFVAAFGVIWGAGAGSAVRADEISRGLACVFPAGTVSTYAQGGFANQPAARLAFDLAEIDVERQSAQLVASPGAAPGSVRIVRALNANHFLEVAGEGFLNLTTVYDKDAVTGGHPAVHSRHFGLLGQPVYAQYTGTCTPR